MLIDSHCHLDRLDLTPYNGSLDALLDAARGRGVGKFLCIGVDADNAATVQQLADSHADVFCSVGIHPLDLKDGKATDLVWLLERLQHPRTVAIGETGLDYHYQPELAEQQKASFAIHLEAAKQTGKPVVIHTRAARQDTLEMLRAADWEMARAALDMGYYLSLSGIVTFRNADALREVARQVPADRLLVETDSPYLAPVPHRGKSNEPQFVCEVAAFLAELRGEALEHFREQTTDNFHRLFPLAQS